MSLYSETTGKHNEFRFSEKLRALGYTEALIFRYYTARVSEKVGVSLSTHSRIWARSTLQIHFFLWGDEGNRDARERYASYVIGVARGHKDPLSKVILLDADIDLLTLKCVIEDAHSKILEKLHGDD